jgi:RNA 3'-terminal phosphate cyclase (ATP)
VLSATGGTDVTWSPTAAYHRFVKLPLLRRWGLDASLAVERTGFYPAGGGRATLSVQPWSPTPATLRTRGELDRVTVHSKASVSLADGAVADRQADRAVEALGTASLPATVADVEYVETDSPGSALLLCGEYGETLLGVDALGERGTTSETVAEDAVANFRDSHEAGAPVDAHAADQVMVVLALAGGRVRIPRVTDHVATNRDLLERFGSDLRIDHTEGPTLVASPHPALD